MLDIKRIRKNPEELIKAMKARRNKGADVSGLLELDEKRRMLIQEVEQLKAKRNEDSAKVPMLKKQGLDAAEILAEMKTVADKIKVLDQELAIRIPEPGKHLQISFAIRRDLLESLIEIVQRFSVPIVGEEGAGLLVHIYADSHGHVQFPSAVHIRRARDHITCSD
mgnify:CR=1 FL=1